VPNQSKPRGVAKESKGVAGKEEAGETHRGSGPGGGEGPTGRGEEKAGGGGKCDGIVGEG